MSVLSNVLCFLKKCKRRSWVSLNRNFPGMLKMLQEMMALPGHCVAFPLSGSTEAAPECVTLAPRP